MIFILTLVAISALVSAWYIWNMNDKRQKLIDKEIDDLHK
jgi:hypothetical protein